MYDVKIVCGTKYIKGTNVGNDPYGRLTRKKMRMETMTPKNKKMFQCCDLMIAWISTTKIIEMYKRTPLKFKSSTKPRPLSGFMDGTYMLKKNKIIDW